LGFRYVFATHKNSPKVGLTPQPMATP